MMISKKPRRLADRSAKPKIIPIKMRKKICRISPSFKANSACGKTMYMVTPTDTVRSPKRIYGATLVLFLLMITIVPLKVYRAVFRDSLRLLLIAL